MDGSKAKKRQIIDKLRVKIGVVNGWLIVSEMTATGFAG